jgi:hypothetical protein
VTTQACDQPTGYVANDDDCNDACASCHPGGVEVCDGLNNDCDGQTDEGNIGQIWYRDADGDGYGNPNVTLQRCNQPSGYVANDDDCNDACASCYPGGVEVCDGLNNDCDGQTDEGNIGQIWYRDADGDGYGNPNVTAQACNQPSGYVTNYDDCNDACASCYPGALELCDGLNNDCDGQTDEGDVCGEPDSDADGDPDASDCNDADASVHHGAAEICDAQDNDCDGQTDEGDVCAEPDSDGDGDPDASDCNDSDPSVHNGAAEICDAQDNDCDGVTDEGCGNCNCNAPPPYIPVFTWAGAAVGAYWEQQLPVAGGCPPYTWSQTSGELPPGISLFSDGTLSGWPSAPGTYLFRVRVADCAGASAEGNASVHVTPCSSNANGSCNGNGNGNGNGNCNSGSANCNANTGCPPLRITTYQLPGATPGTYYNQALSATGGCGSYSWNVEGLPAELHLDGNTINGIPSTARDYVLRVRVRDGAGAMAERDLQLTVNAAPCPPLRIMTSELPDATLGRSYNQRLGATGGCAPYAWSTVGAQLPMGLDLQGDTIVGTPSDGGEYVLHIRVEDAAGSTAQSDVPLRVRNCAEDPDCRPVPPNGNGNGVPCGACGGVGVISMVPLILGMTAMRGVFVRRLRT